MNVWAASCRLETAFGASRKLLVRLKQLLGAPGKSIPALRELNGAPRQRNLETRQPIVALRKPVPVPTPAIAAIALLRHLLVASSQSKFSDSQ